MERRLAAILAADVVGYSRLVHEDEEGTLRMLGVHRGMIDELVGKHRGRIFGSAGDSVIAEFASPVEAVRCAMDIQHEFAKRIADIPEDRRMEFRIGVNLGDVVVEGDDLLGDGVNIAARLQELADPGGICATDEIRRHVEGKIDASFIDLGDQTLKNIPTPVRVHRVQVKGVGLRRVAAQEDKPSIAVLPFTNMSGDPEQEYFSDGITEDIITELSRFRSMIVIARNSSFAFKGQAVDLTEVGKKLGVRYVVEGSVRKDGNRIRVTVELAEAASRSNLWTGRYDRDLEDVFAVQDELVRTIVGVLPGRLSSALLDQTRRQPTENLNAYDLVLQASHLRASRGEENIAKAVEFYKQALELDPNYAAAYAGIAKAECLSVFDDYGHLVEDALSRALDAARKAVALDDGNDEAHTALAMVNAFFGEHELARYHANRAVSLNPNSSEAQFWIAQVTTLSGDAEVGIEIFESIEHLDPFFCESPIYLEILGDACYMARRYEDAIAAFKRITDPIFYIDQEIAFCYAQLGRMDEAGTYADRFQRSRPRQWDARRHHTAHMRMIKREADRDHWTEGYRNAGFDV